MTIALLAVAAGCARRPLPLDEQSADFAASQDISPSVDLAAPDFAAPDLSSAALLVADFSAGDLTSRDLAAALVEARYGWPGPLRWARRISIAQTLAWRVDVPAPMTLEALGLVANEADGRVTLALYDDAGDRPGALVAEAAASDAIVAPGPLELPVSARALVPGAYWLALRAAPHVTLLYDNNVAARACVRTPIQNVDDPWPAEFGGSGGCDTQGAIGLYLVGRARAGGDLGSAPPPVSGASDGGFAGVVGWPSPLPSPWPFAAGIGMEVTVPPATTLDRFGMVAAESGGLYRMALYHDSLGRPGALVALAAAPRAVLAGANEIDVFDRPLFPGRYWLAIWVTQGVVLRIGGGNETQLCNYPSGSIGSAWNSFWGSGNCGSATPAFNFYLVTRR